MKLLIISNNLNRPSYRQRIGDNIATLEKHGIEVTVHKLPRRKLQRLKLFAQARKFNAVLLHKKCLNVFDAYFLRKFSRKIIYDFDDAIMYSPYKSHRNRSSHLKLFKRTVKMVDVIIAGNEYLAEHARRSNKNVHVLSTGLNINAYQCPIPAEPDKPIRLVWIGSESTQPFLLDLKSVLEEIGKQYKNISLRIIADAFFNLENMPVEKCNWSLETQATDLITCDIGLAPLPDNRFTLGKCGFKILQYFAAGLPVVASPVGANKTFIEDSKAGLLATNHSQWKDAIVRLIEDARLCNDMKCNAKKYVQQFDSNILAEKFTALIKQTMLAD